ncbi:acyl-CoA-binding protein [Aquimarina sp. ERC-38]|uniref:acyl-CoA-binding protein n=1 Tax=Aquimarina sp. ERC-38 TaxID=2949996 RepID=UPI0022478EF9|nr:acyl-CoA-binding protein [Aquimarina sp. ERC-38]UZO80563.1 acyl-CoA-binding protein [Aquimarina sp. ERC-38]
MKDEELNIRFREAFEKASKTKIKLPPDIMLHFYAYYKQATINDYNQFHTPSGQSELRNAFKLNALFQIKDLTTQEAKREYIALVEKYIK